MVTYLSLTNQIHRYKNCVKMATDFKIAQPREYYRKYLEQDVRPDSRELGEIRPTTINIGSITTADGSALVKLGETTVICGIKAELAAPTAEDPKCGYVVPNVDLPPLCSANFKAGPPSEVAQAACVFLDNVIKNSNCIDLETLCVEEGKVVWVIYCDVMCLNYDGNLLDACCSALLAALKNVQIPKVTVSEETGLPETDLSNRQPLHIASQPVATTFAIFDDSILLTDPTEEEENLATGSVTIVTRDDGQLCMEHKAGGSGLTDDQVAMCIDRAATRAKQLRILIDDIINDVER